MMIKKYYFLILFMHCSNQFFGMLPIAQFAAIRSKLIQVASQHSCLFTRSQISEKLEKCKDPKDVVTVLHRMVKNLDIHGQNSLALELIEASASEKLLTNQETIRLLTKARNMDPLFNPIFSVLALDLAVRLGKNKILQGSDIVPFLEESIDICGFGSDDILRVKDLIEDDIVTIVDKPNVLSFVRKILFEIKAIDQTDEHRSTLNNYYQNVSDLVTALEQKNIVTDQEKNELFK